MKIGIVGTGAVGGFFGTKLKLAGFDVDVIEKEERCCEFLSNIVCVNTIKSNAPHKVIKSTKSYDAIVLWHVIEHLPSVWEFLENAAKNLNVGGVLLIATPNPSAFQFRVQGDQWPHVDAPRHLFLIPSELLVKFLKPLGLDPVMATFSDKGAKSWNRFGWQRYLMNRFSNKWLQGAAFVVGRAVAMPMGFFDSRKGRGSAYTIIFRKTTAI